MAVKSAVAAIAGAPLALAASEGAAGFDVANLVKESVSSVQGQLFSVLGVVVPSIVVVTGAVVGVKFAISWIKRIRG